MNPKLVDALEWSAVLTRLAACIYAVVLHQYDQGTFGLLLAHMMHEAVKEERAR